MPHTFHFFLPQKSTCSKCTHVWSAVACGQVIGSSQLHAGQWRAIGTEFNIKAFSRFKWSIQAHIKRLSWGGYTNIILEPWWAHTRTMGHVACVIEWYERVWHACRVCDKTYNHSASNIALALQYSYVHQALIQRFCMEGGWWGDYP